MAAATAESLERRLEQIQEEAKELRGDKRIKEQIMEQATEVIQDLAVVAKKAKTQVEVITEKLREVISPERAIISAMGAFVATGVTVLAVNAGINALANHSATINKYKGYLQGGTQILLGTAETAVALYTRDKDSGLTNDIAAATGFGTLGYGIGSCVSTYWDHRKAVQAMMQALLQQAAEQQRLQQEQAVALQAAQADAAAQQGQGQGNQ